MTLGQRIQELRRQAGLSQEGLGEKLGVSRQAVSKWESDSGVPELDTLIAMSRLFGVTLGSLLGVEEDGPEPEETSTPPAVDEEKLEELLEGFLSNLERGFYDDGGNWVDVTPVETDWVDEDDCVMKAKMAVQIKVVCKYGIFKDVAAWTSPEGTEMELTTGKDEDGQQ